jgi:hypothetical protein
MVATSRLQVTERVPMNSTTTSDRRPEVVTPGNPVADRALELAARWFPTGLLTLTGVSGSEATVLIELDGDIFIVRYEDLDRVPRCEFCGRPL